MKYVLIVIFLFPAFLLAQNDLLSEIDTDSSATYASAAFKGLKIVNFESTKLVSKKELYFVVAHRFASVEHGFDDFFGLDNAVTQLNLIYGISDGFNVSVARSSFQKTYVLSTKYRLLRQQNNGFPFTVVGYNGLSINTDLDKANLPKLEFKHRIGYVAQLLISRKFNKNFSLQLIPTFFHDNYVPNGMQDNSQYVIGLGGRHKITKRLSLNVDYGIHLNRASNSVYTNPLSIGCDIETGGHVFQLHFTNAQSMFENGYLGQGAGDWSEGTIYFGFNISRVF